MTTLRQMIKESPHMDEYEKVCMSATALPPILQVAKKGLTDANTGDWLERRAQIEGEVEQLRAKAGEYGITVQTEDIKTIEGAVSEIRAACISIELCSHFGDAELVKKQSGAENENDSGAGEDQEVRARAQVHARADRESLSRWPEDEVRSTSPCQSRS
eukprot:6499809-Pyramimonas_sp.AAC.1